MSIYIYRERYIVYMRYSYEQYITGKLLEEWVAGAPFHRCTPGYTYTYYIYLGLLGSVSATEFFFCTFVFIIHRIWDNLVCAIGLASKFCL